MDNQNEKKALSGILLSNFRRLKMRSGNCNVQGAPYTGRPVSTDGDKIKALIETDRRMRRETAGKFDVSNLIVYLHSQQLGHVSRLDVCLP